MLSASASAAPLPVVPAVDAEPVAVARGVLVVAVVGPGIEGPAVVDAATSAVRGTTRSLMDGAPTELSLARGMVFFERASEVPVAVGAPRRADSMLAECDAVLFDQDGRWGGVGAVSNLESPVRLAVEVLDRGWGFVVGAGASALARELGVMEQSWLSPASSESKAGGANAGPLPNSADGASETTLDAGAEASRSDGGAQSAASASSDAGLARVASPDLGSAMDAAGAPPVPVDGGSGVGAPRAMAGDGDVSASSSRVRPAIAALLLRDAAGRFFVAVEACGVEGAPAGQLTTLSERGANVFVGDQGAIVVATSRSRHLSERLAERVYRRLSIVKIPRIVADWGLQIADQDAVVAVVSRFGSAIAARPPSTWAMNQAGGESTSADAAAEESQPYGPPAPPQTVAPARPPLPSSLAPLAGPPPAIPSSSVGESASVDARGSSPATQEERTEQGSSRSTPPKSGPGPGGSP